MEFLRVRRWEKRNKTDFYWEVLKATVGITRHVGIETFCLLSPKFIRILNYIKSLCITFVLNWFKYFDHKIRQFLSKNALISSDQIKCFNTPMLYTTVVPFRMLVILTILPHILTILPNMISEPSFNKWWQ